MPHTVEFCVVSEFGQLLQLLHRGSRLATDVAARAVAQGKKRKMLGSQLGRYKILSLLGAGGMGEVYLAYDPHLDRRVAIKVLPTHLVADVASRERLRRE